MQTAKPHRWYHLTPDRLILVLLPVEGLLWLSERLGWFSFNEHKGWTVLIAIAVVGIAMLFMLGWFFAAVVFRWRFQYSIRSLMVLTVAVALPFSWLAVEMKEAKEQREAVEEFKKLYGEVGQLYYDYEYITFRSPFTNPEPPGPVWLRELLGGDLFASVASVELYGSKVTDAGLEQLRGMTQLVDLNLHGADVTDTGLEHLKRLTRLEVLSLCGTKVTDAGLEHLKGLTQLFFLALEGDRITDAGLEHLKGLTQLRQLNLGGTQVTDAGLDRLKGLAQLRQLLLDNTQVTDAGLECLKGMSQVNELNLKGTKVTDEGVQRLQQALPNCTITH